MPFGIIPPDGGAQGAVPFGSRLPGGPDGWVPFGITPSGGGPHGAVPFVSGTHWCGPDDDVPESVRFPATRLLPENLVCPNPDAAAVAMTSIRMQKTPINRAICLFGFIGSSSIRIHTIPVYILQCDKRGIYYIQNMACVLIFTCPSQLLNLGVRTIVFRKRPG